MGTTLRNKLEWLEAYHSGEPDLIYLAYQNIFMRYSAHKFDIKKTQINKYKIINSIKKITKWCKAIKEHFLIESKESTLLIHLLSKLDEFCIFYNQKYNGKVWKEESKKRSISIIIVLFKINNLKANPKWRVKTISLLKNHNSFQSFKCLKQETNVNYQATRFPCSMNSSSEYFGSSCVDDINIIESKCSIKKELNQKKVINNPNKFMALKSVHDYIEKSLKLQLRSEEYRRTPVKFDLIIEKIFIDFSIKKTESLRFTIKEPYEKE